MKAQIIWYTKRKQKLIETIDRTIEKNIITFWLHFWCSGFHSLKNECAVRKLSDE